MVQIENDSVGVNIVNNEVAKKFDELINEFGLNIKRLLPIYTFVFASKNLISDYEFVRKLLENTDLNGYDYDRGGKAVYSRLFGCLFAYIDQVDSDMILSMYISSKNTEELFEYRRENVYSRYLEFYGKDKKTIEDEAGIPEENISSMTNKEYLDMFMEKFEEDSVFNEELQHSLVEVKEQLSVLAQNLEISHIENKKNIEEKERLIADYNTNLQIKDDTINKLKLEVSAKDQELRTLKSKYNSVLTEQNRMQVADVNNVVKQEVVPVTKKYNRFFSRFFDNKKEAEEVKIITYDDVLLSSKELSAEQLEVIVGAITTGLSPVQLLDICDKEYSVEKMKQLIRIIDTTNHIQSNTVNSNYINPDMNEDSKEIDSEILDDYDETERIEDDDVNDDEETEMDDDTVDYGQDDDIGDYSDLY